MIIKMKLLSLCKSAIQQVKINIDGGAIQMLLGRWVGGGWGEGGLKGPLLNLWNLGSCLNHLT